MSHDWDNGLFGCFSAGGDCLIGCCCPCITYGETEHRLSHMGELEAESHSVCNAPCAIFCLLSAFTGGIGPCLMSMFQRTKVRDQFGVTGGEFGDCCAAWCCTPCVVIQNKQEVVSAQHQKGVYAATMGAPVQPAMQQPMVYGQPPV